MSPARYSLPLAAEDSKYEGYFEDGLGPSRPKANRQTVPMPRRAPWHQDLERFYLDTGDNTRPMLEQFGYLEGEEHPVRMGPRPQSLGRLMEERFGLPEDMSQWGDREYELWEKLFGERDPFGPGMDQHGRKIVPPHREWSHHPANPRAPYPSPPIQPGEDDYTGSILDEDY